MILFKSSQLCYQVSTALNLGFVILLTGCGGGSSNSAPAAIAKLSNITVSPANVSIAIGYTASLKATANYADGSSANVTSQVTWSSAASGIVNVAAKIWPVLVP